MYFQWQDNIYLSFSNILVFSLSFPNPASPVFFFFFLQDLIFEGLF